MKINKNILDAPYPKMWDFFEEAKSLDKSIDLSVGDVDFDINNKYKKKAIRQIKIGFNKYSNPQGDHFLRNIIAKYKNEKNIEITTENILIASASNCLAYSLLLLPKNSEVIIFDPYYPPYKQLINILGLKLKIIETNKDYSLNIKKLKENISTKTSAMIINNPNNPTGKIYSKSQIEKLINLANKHDILLISDEVYEQFDYEKKHISLIKKQLNCIIINSFSKSHGASGWRIGYCIAEKKIINELKKLHLYISVCSPTPLQKAFEEPIQLNNKIINEFIKKRKYVFEKLKSIGYETQIPDGAYYFFIKYPYDSELFIENCKKNKLFISPGINFSEKNTHFRISYGVKMSILKKGLKILENVFKNE